MHPSSYHAQLVLLQAFGLMVRQRAEVENKMNSVGCIVYYALDLDEEPHRETPERKLDALRSITGEL